MGTYTIILEDTPSGKVAVIASGKPSNPLGEIATPAQELFITLLEALQEETDGEFCPEIRAHH